LWPGPGGGPGRWLRSGRRRASEIFGDVLPGLGLWFRDRYRGHGEGSGDVGGHLAQFGRQPDRVGPQLVGLPLGGLAHRLGLLSRLPFDLLGLPLGLACRVGLVSRLPPYLLGLPLSGLAYRAGLLHRLLPDTGGLAVGIRQDPFCQPDRILAPQSPGVPPDGVKQPGLLTGCDLGQLPDAGVGEEDLDPAIDGRNVVVCRRRGLLA
jgi:hypothetical protein